MAHTPVRVQDGLDGKSLRLLREALPKDWWYEVGMDEDDIAELPFRVEIGGPDHSSNEPFAVAWATGIAQAADKCRAALPPDVDKLRSEDTI